METEVSSCCKARIEKDLGGIGVFSLTSGSLICSHCKRYCYYMPKSVSTQTHEVEDFCPNCEGRGDVNIGKSICTICNGKGKLLFTEVGKLI